MRSWASAEALSMVTARLCAEASDSSGTDALLSVAEAEAVVQQGVRLPVAAELGLPIAVRVDERGPPAQPSDSLLFVNPSTGVTDSEWQDVSAAILARVDGGPFGGKDLDALRSFLACMSAACIGGIAALEQPMLCVNAFQHWLRQAPDGEGPNLMWPRVRLQASHPSPLSGAECPWCRTAWRRGCKPTWR